MALGPLESALYGNSSRKVEVSKLAAPAILYRLFDEDEVLLYVGVTDDIIRRLKRHMKTQPWANRIAMVSVEDFDTRDIALEMEREVVVAERPLFNKQLQPPPPPGDGKWSRETLMRRMTMKHRDLL